MGLHTFRTHLKGRLKQVTMNKRDMNKPIYKQMRYRFLIASFAVLLLSLASCNKQWDEYYKGYPETVDGNIWNEIQNNSEFSAFLQIIKEAEMDTLFDSGITYTILAPTNNAIANFQGGGSFDKTILAYHFCSHFVGTSSIQGKRQVQTLTKKFALFERNGNEVFIDGVEVADESPLYGNGKYFTMNQVMQPRPNIYEYYQTTNPVFTAYIDSQDTIIIDKEKSEPLGFDEDGNTVYDTVSTVENKFEMEYFPIKQEFRSLSGTVVFPLEKDYQEALTVMAQSLGGNYNTYQDIPIDWQQETLIPHLLYQGVFLNRLEPEEFEWKSPIDTLKLLNVLGDSVVINYVPTDKAFCSNGYAYNYETFKIPDSLYNGGIKLEGEELVYSTGLNKFSWEDEVTVVTDISIVPNQDLIPGASNDSIIRVLFPKGYDGKFSVEFKSPKLFPRKYVLEIATHMDFGGEYNIYINDELVKTFNYYEYIIGNGIIRSVTGERLRPRGRFNRFDMWVDNINDYGSVKIKIEYKGPGIVANNGFVLDYIRFIPAIN